MKISKITIENFRSIGRCEIDPSSFNVLVGQNNHGKSNFLEAIEWFYNGSGNVSELIRQESDSDMSVEIEFSGIQDGLEKMINEKNKASLMKEFEGEERVKIIRRYNREDKNIERLVFYPKRNSGEYAKSVTGFDKTLNDFLPRLQFVKTELSLKDKVKYGSTTEIGQMLSEVINEVLISNDPSYKSFLQEFDHLFVGEDSKISQQIDQISSTVAGYLKRQFPECEKVEFKVNSPKFEDLLKNFEANVDDGYKTSAQEKGDGMQRALMLAIIQTYAEYRRRNENIKDFVFLIDEAELHLHPTAQRSLKKSLIELAQEGNQVLITSHSSVLIADEFVDQKIFKVSKTEKITSIVPIGGKEKKDIVYDLLGGSPADLLLPRNFLLVEGTSDKQFLDIIIERFYSDKQQIQIIPVWGDIDKVERVFSSLESTFAPLNESLYEGTLVIMIDQIDEGRRGAYDEFLRKYPKLSQNAAEQIYTLNVGSLEEYYPTAPVGNVGGHNQPVMWKHSAGHNMSSVQKHKLAKCVGEAIEREQFESEMPIILSALNKCWELAY